MITFTLDPNDLQRLLALADPKLFQKGIDIALKRIGLEMQKDSAENAPYLTGNLRRSIHSFQDTNSVTTGTDVDYARVHEFGRGRIKPKLYLTGAFQSQQNGRALDHLNAEISRLWK